MKLSKAATKKHEEAVSLVKNGKKLSVDEKVFILDNWNPMASHNVGKTGTFFTPFLLARDFAHYIVGGGVVVDACAGIGTLSYADFLIETDGDGSGTRYVCIEQNPDFVEVGKRIMPQAEWIEDDAFDAKTWHKIGRVDEVISNPPFVRIQPSNFDPPLKAGKKSVYLMAEIALRFGKRGAFIVDQMSCPFKFSGVLNYREVENTQFERFREKTGIDFEVSSIDTSVYLDDWAGVKTQVEIVNLKRRQNG